MAVKVREKEKDREFSFAIKEHIGVISTYQSGWTKEVNVVQWNGGADKLDIRDWDGEHEHMSRGITLYEEEAKTLMDLLTSYFKGDDCQSYCEE